MELDNLKPQIVIDAIKTLFKLDIAVKSRKGDYADLRSLYFYICKKNCKNDFDDVPELVNCKRSTFLIMSGRAEQRINTNGYEELAKNYNKILDYLKANPYGESLETLIQMKKDYEQKITDINIKINKLKDGDNR